MENRSCASITIHCSEYFRRENLGEVLQSNERYSVNLPEYAKEGFSNHPKAQAGGPALEE